jgi:hypothetical protein
MIDIESNLIGCLVNKLDHYGCNEECVDTWYHNLVVRAVMVGSMNPRLIVEYRDAVGNRRLRTVSIDEVELVDD